MRIYSTTNTTGLKSMWLADLANRSSKAINSIARHLNGIGAVALVLMMLLTVADVCLRYFFSLPINGAYEIIEFFMSILVAFGIAHAMVQKSHISVDFIIKNFSPRSQAVLNTITCFFCIILFLLIAWRSVLYAENLRQGGDVSALLNVPIYPFVYIVAIGCFLLCLTMLTDFFDSLTKAILGVPWWRKTTFLLIIAIVIIAFGSLLLGKNFPLRVTSLTAGFIGIGFLLIFLFSGMPIGISMAFIGFLGMSYVNGLGPGLNILGTTMFTTASSYSLSVIPLFVLMGAFCLHAGLSKELYSAVNKWLGHFRGGMAMATVGACAGFAAVSGSSIATTATMGMVALPEMKRFKYDEGLAAGAIAAGGSIGVLIPPSVILVIYAILTEQSIGKLFMAGFIPGVLEALFYMITIYIICKRFPARGPKAEKFPFRVRISSLKNVWGVLALFILVIGGIYTGLFTPTEAAGIGCFGAFLFALFKKKLTWEKLAKSLDETGKTTAMVFIILIGAGILGYFLAVTRLPFELSTFVGTLNVNRYVVLGLIIVLYLLLGAIMSSMAMIVLTVPIIFPVIQTLGFDPIWFGIIIVRVVEIGQITPPVGINVYVMKGVAKDIPLGTIFKGVIPFVIADICHLALLIVFPGVVTFLPSLMS